MNKLITVLACTLTFASVGLGQTTGEPLVIDSQSGKPVAKVHVSIYGPVAKKMLLGQDARSVLALLPKGRYTLTFSAEGYETKQIELVKQENEASGLKQLKLVALREGGNGRYDDLIVSEEDGTKLPACKTASPYSPPHVTPSSALRATSSAQLASATEATTPSTMSRCSTASG